MIAAMAKPKTKSKPPLPKPTARNVRKTSPPAKPISLYFWPTPNGKKIAIMLEETGLPYVLQPVNIGRGEQFKPEFLAISPNNRMPAIVDPEGPGGKPISVFESGAILQYLGRKSGRFYPVADRARVAVEEWLYWQVGGLGPMAGQVHHFRNYVTEPQPYATQRYINEVNRLYGVMDRRLGSRDYLAGSYSIADMAAFPWAVGAESKGQNIDDFPNVKAWIERVGRRSAVIRGMHVGAELRSATYSLRDDEEAKKILFGQRSR